ncbi:MAG: M23 family metallopeptidase [Bacteroidota bacterium]
MIHPKQITFIRRHLRERGLHNRELLEEMTDHYLTEIEDEMEKGHSFEAALSICLDLHQGWDMKKLNRSIFFIHHKSKIFMASMSVICMAFFAYFQLATPVEAPVELPQITELHELSLEIQMVSFEPPNTWPIKTREKEITSAFGMRMHPEKKVKQHHMGIDIRADEGTPVYAPETGTVLTAKYDGKKGNYIQIQHDETYTTRYYHLKSFDVKAGDKIEKGDKIGEVGSTGYSFGPHLHYEVRKNGKAVDPEDYLGLQ